MTRILLGVALSLLAAWVLATFGIRQGIEIISAAALIVGFGFAMVWLRLRLTRGCGQASQEVSQPNTKRDTAASTRRAA